MTMRRTMVACCLALAFSAFADDIPWPSDFEQQVVQNHPAPSGSQIGAHDAAVSIDGRAYVSDVSALSVACAEGRTTSFWCSNEALIDALARMGIILVVR